MMRACSWARGFRIASYSWRRTSISSMSPFRKLSPIAALPVRPSRVWMSHNGSLRSADRSCATTGGTLAPSSPISVANSMNCFTLHVPSSFSSSIRQICAISRWLGRRPSRFSASVSCIRFNGASST